MKELLFYLFLLPFSGWGQLTVEVNLRAGEQTVILNQPIQLKDRSFQLDQARFYLSKFEFYKNDQLIASDSTEAYLVDLESDSTRKLIFPDIQSAQVDEIRFLFGIDSVTNTSGAMSGALDPMHGMYWSWQSGYINCKLEGTFVTPKREVFQLHLGGYASPFSGAQKIVLESNKTGKTNLNIDLNLLMEEVLRPQSNLQVMSPGTKAVEYARLIAQSIHTEP